MRLLRLIRRRPDAGKEEARLATSGQELAAGLESMFRLTAGLHISVTSRVAPLIRGKEKTFSRLILELTNRSGTDVQMEDIRAATETYLAQQSPAHGKAFHMIYKET